MRTGTLYALGSVNVDLQMRVDAWPQPGDTSMAHDFALLSGGKAGNVAFLARRLGVDATLFGVIGQDELAHVVLEKLAAIGVDLRHLQRVPDNRTGIATVLVGPQGQKTIVQAPNANLAWDSTAVGAMRDALHAAPSNSLLVVDLEVPAEVASAALESACARHMPVILDPTPTFRMSPRLLQGVDYLTPNAAEAGRLMGMLIDSPGAAAVAGRKFLQAGVVGAALIKLSAGGSVVVAREEAFLVPAPHVFAVDRTGAGDAFAGALGVAMLEGKPLREAARFAVAASTLAVTRYGAQPSYPTRTEIERLLRACEADMRVREIGSRPVSQAQKARESSMPERDQDSQARTAVPPHRSLEESSRRDGR